MSEPSRAHVEAVALTVSRANRLSERDALQEAPHWEWASEAILTSTDPAVLDAMQDALVRAGRLAQSWQEWGVQRPEPFEGVFPASSREGAMRSAANISATHDGLWQVVSRRRFATPWEPTPCSPCSSSR